MIQAAQDEQKVRDGIFFKAFHGQPSRKYPSWRYHKIFDPILVHNTAQDEKVKREGWEPVFIPITANKYLSNWFWDLEDMSVKQLMIFAQEEYGIKLPVEAGQERLLKAVLQLSRMAPQNAGRIIFMAHQIKMNLDDFYQEVKKAQENAIMEKEDFIIWA